MVGSERVVDLKFADDVAFSGGFVARLGTGYTKIWYNYKCTED